MSKGILNEMINDVDVNESDSCPICCDSFTKTEISQNSDEIYLTECKHIFHLKCILLWINSANDQIKTCPYCRTEINNNKIRNSYKTVYPTNDIEEKLTVETFSKMNGVRKMGKTYILNLAEDQCVDNLGKIFTFNKVNINEAV